jgi:hypothetical protein
LPQIQTQRSRFHGVGRRRILPKPPLLEDEGRLTDGQVLIFGHQRKPEVDLPLFEAAADRSPGTGEAVPVNRGVEFLHRGMQFGRKRRGQRHQE